MKKIWLITVLLLAMTLALVMTACGNVSSDTETKDNPGQDSETVDPGSDTETDPVIRSGEWFNEDGSFKYALMRSDYASTKLGTASAQLLIALADAFKLDRKDISIRTDYVPRGEAVPQDQYEILIGETNRDADDAYKAALNEGGVIIVGEGTKIMILGYDENSTINGVNWFITQYLNPSIGSDGVATCPVPKGVLYQVEPDFSVHLVTPVYSTNDQIVADIDLSGPTGAYYGIDNTGYADCTTALQMALDAVASKGGGTVYLPAGQYRITKQIRIPVYCTLVGDWQDPDVGTDYGTVILADVTETTPSLFLIAGSAGVRGLTIYYPNQSLKDIKKYDFTFYTNGQGASYMLASVTNCTVINGYQGIGACVYESNAHEQFSIENVKGTFIRTAAEVYNQADVGTWKRVTVNTSYWAKCPLNKTPITEAEIKSYTRKNTVGLILGDLEWTEFAGFYVNDCKYGIQIVDGKRIQFAGSIYDAVVADCDVALRIDNIDSRWGMTITNSSLSGSSKSIENRAAGLVKMSNVTLNGAKSGNIKDEGSNSMASFKIDYTRTYVKPAANLTVFEGTKTDTTDQSGAVQSALDALAEKGGILYLPAGIYRFDNPITVPAGVELRGASASPNRDTGSSDGGTLLLAFCQDGSSFGESTQAFITLKEGAGVNGVRICFPENGPLDENLSTSYAVRGQGKNVYCVNCAIYAAAYGIDFSGCDDHYIKKLSSCCYYTTMKVGGNNGVIEGCLQNGTVLVRANSGLSKYKKNWISEGDVFTLLFDPITRESTRYIRITEGSGELVYNTFAYGPNVLITNEGGTDAKVVSVGADNIGGYLIESKAGSMKVLGALRYNKKSINYVGGSLEVYTRLTINNKDEEPYQK